MVLLDYIVLIPLCWFAFMGFKRGLIYELTSILALVLGVWASYRFSDTVALLLPNIPFAKTIVYEAHVKGFTKLFPDLAHAGTYRALADKRVIKHLKNL